MKESEYGMSNLDQNLMQLISEHVDTLHAEDQIAGMIPIKIGSKRSNNKKKKKKTKRNGKRKYNKKKK